MPPPPPPAGLSSEMQNSVCQTSPQQFTSKPKLVQLNTAEQESRIEIIRQKLSRFKYEGRSEVANTNISGNKMFNPSTPAKPMHALKLRK